MDVYLIFDYDCTNPHHSVMVPLAVTKNYKRALALASEISESFPHHYIRKIPII